MMHASMRTVHGALQPIGPPGCRYRRLPSAAWRCAHERGRADHRLEREMRKGRRKKKRESERFKREGRRGARVMDGKNQ